MHQYEAALEEEAEVRRLFPRLKLFSNSNESVSLPVDVRTNKVFLVLKRTSQFLQRTRFDFNRFSVILIMVFSSLLSYTGKTTGSPEN